jgi:phosphoglucosamine mutase
MAEQQRKLFGTDGIRGIANQDPITIEMAMRVGQAAAIAFKNADHRHKIVIGKDTRLSGYMLETALAAGISSMGVDVLLVGPLPTPGIAFITSSMRADAGIVISASHNSFEDNGIKFFAADGFKLPDEKEAEIERLIFSDTLQDHRASATDVGKAYKIADARGRYVQFLKNSLPRERTLDGLKIVVDCANGATYRVAPQVLEELGAEVISICVSPNGRNINRNCGAMHPELAAKAVLENKAHVGIALDGDGDRVIFIDEKGEIVDGDAIMAIVGLDMLRAGKLKNKTLVTTVMSNLGLDIALREAGGTVEKTNVGDRYVVERMREGGFNVGGEQSGHLVFLDWSTTGDGICSALQVLNIMLEKKKPLSELKQVMNRLPQVLVNASVKEKRSLDEMPNVQALIRDVEARLNGRGRVLVRYSGTENKIRVMLEGEDEPALKKWANEITELAIATLASPVGA